MPPSGTFLDMRVHILNEYKVFLVEFSTILKSNANLKEGQKLRGKCLITNAFEV